MPRDLARQLLDRIDAERGGSQPITVVPTKPVPQLGPLVPSSVTIPENTLSGQQWNFSVQISPPAEASQVSQAQVSLAAGAAYDNDHWTIFGVRVSGGRVRFQARWTGPRLDFETVQSWLVGIRVELPAGPQTAETEHVYSLLVRVGDVPEAPTIVAGLDPLTINLNSQATDRPVSTDLSDRFSDTEPAGTPGTAPHNREWQLQIATDLPSPAVAVAAVRGKTLDLTPAGGRTGTQTMQVRAQDVADPTLLSRPLTITVVAQADLYPVRWEWSRNPSRSVPDATVDSAGTEQITLNPGSSGQPAAFYLGEWIATPKTPGASALPARTYALSGPDAADFLYAPATGAFQYDGPAFAPDTDLQVSVAVSVAATATNEASTSPLLSFRLRAGWKPEVSFGQWQRIGDLPEGARAAELASISWDATGLPPGLTGANLVPSWRLAENAGLALHMADRSDDGGVLEYYGAGESRADGTRKTARGELTVRYAGSDHRILPATEETQDYTLAVVPPAPLWPVESYTFDLADGSQPRTAGETDEQLGSIAADPSADYRLGGYRITENSGDPERQFAAVAAMGGIYYAGPSAASIAAAPGGYQLKAGAVYMAADGDIGPVGEVDVRIRMIDKANDTAIANPDWRPPGGTTRSINVGETFDIDAGSAWRVPAGATQAISGSAADTAVIAVTDTDDVFAVRGLAVGTTTLDIDNQVTFADGTVAAAPQVQVKVQVHLAHEDTPHMWLELSGDQQPYAGALSQSRSLSVAEGAARADVLTANRVALWYPDANTRLGGNSIADDTADAVIITDTDIVQATVPGQTGPQSVLAFDLAVDGTRFDYEQSHLYSVRIDAHYDAYSDGTTDWGAFTAYFPLRISITDRNELPVRRTGVPWPDITGRVGAAVSPIDLAARYSDPEGRTLSFRVTSSAPAIVSGAIQGHGQEWQPQLNAVGTATITVEATDGTGQPPAYTTPGPADRFQITVEAGALIVPRLRWQNPESGNLVAFVDADAPVGRKIARSVFAAKLATPAAEGDLAYSLAPAPLRLPPSPLPRLFTLAWLARQRKWIGGGNFATGRRTERMRLYDRYGEPVSAPSPALAPGLAADGSANPASSSLEIVNVCRPDPDGTSSWDLIVGGLGTLRSGSVTARRAYFVQRARAIAAATADPPPLETYGSYIRATTFFQEALPIGSGEDLRVLVFLNGSRIATAYQFAAAAGTAATVDDSKTLTGAAADADSFEAAAHDGETLWVCCPLTAAGAVSRTLRAYALDGYARRPNLDVPLENAADRCQSLVIDEDAGIIIAVVAQPADGQGAQRRALYLPKPG